MGFRESFAQLFALQSYFSKVLYMGGYLTRRLLRISRARFCLAHPFLASAFHGGGIRQEGFFVSVVPAFFFAKPFFESALHGGVFDKQAFANLPCKV